MERGKFNIAVFLNLQKNFETINHDLLLKKLGRYGMGSAVLNLLRNCLTDRDVLSKWRIVRFKSSYVWNSPRLDSWSTSFLNLFKRFTGYFGVFVGQNVFADDTTLTASGESALDAEVAISHDLATIKQWLSANHEILSKLRIY